MKKLVMFFCLMMVLGGFAFGRGVDSLVQDKGGKDKGKKDQKKEVEKLEKEVEILKRRNQALKRVIKTYQYLLKSYKKRLLERQNPLKLIRRQLAVLIRRIQIAYMRKGLRGAVEEVVRFCKRLLGRKGRAPSFRFKRMKKAYQSPTKRNEKSNLPWKNSLKEAFALAKKQNKMVLVKIGASW
ncbi:MAG: hypothetical protein D6785_13165 [Planctomycetota bacterium]|nr:MAG: hypothetical protein D6785_13165 [Planctomycetota bacterium]